MTAQVSVSTKFQAESFSERGLLSHVPAGKRTRSWVCDLNTRARPDREGNMSVGYLGCSEVSGW